MKSKRTTRKVEAKRKMTGSRNAEEPLATGLAVEQIRLRAYKLYVEHGCSDGRDLDDWFQAEKQLVEEMAANRDRK